MTSPRKVHLPGLTRPKGCHLHCHNLPYCLKKVTAGNWLCTHGRWLSRCGSGCGREPPSLPLSSPLPIHITHLCTKASPPTDTPSGTNWWKVGEGSRSWCWWREWWSRRSSWCWWAARQSSIFASQVAQRPRATHSRRPLPHKRRRCFGVPLSGALVRYVGGCSQGESSFHLIFSLIILTDHN